jgi:hypothetical protein
MEYIMSDNIKIIRLSTGEELIATVNDTFNRDVLNLTDVAILIPTQQNSLGLAPFMAYSNAPEGIQLQCSFVMFTVDPIAGLKKQYQNMFSKIITPTEQKIII